jgi:hypothetical protein
LNACWCLAVNSDKKKNRCMFKWQCLVCKTEPTLVRKT